MVLLNYRVKVSQVKRKPRPKIISERLLNALQPNPNFIPLIDEAELKYLLTVFFHTDPKLLTQLDKSDFDGMGYEKSTSIRSRPNPTTGKTLSNLLGWSDLEQIIGTMPKEDIWALSCWVGKRIWDLSDRGRILSDISKAEKEARYEQIALLPAPTRDLQCKSVKALIIKIKEYL